MVGVLWAGCVDLNTPPAREFQILFVES